MLGDIVQLDNVNDAGTSGTGSAISESIVVLKQVHRFGGAIAELATAVQRGDSDAVVEVLQAEHDDLVWLPVDVADTDPADLEPIPAAVVAAGQTLDDAARAGDGRAALDALGTFRLLCAHRRGPYGVATWTARVESWLAAAIDGFAVGGAWYVGRPLLFTENDYGLRLYNGDTGVVVASQVAPASARSSNVGASWSSSAPIDSRRSTPSRDDGAQGSGFAVRRGGARLARPELLILTRELLYTAVTRARRRLIVAGSEESVRAAVERPIARASGLRWRLWRESPKA